MKLTFTRCAVVGALAIAAMVSFAPVGAKAASDVDSFNASTCNPVLGNRDPLPVVSSSGLYVIHKDSYSCPKATQAAPAATAQTDFLVFFDWNKSSITKEARKIISDAAAAYGKQKAVRIDVVGHTDTSGSPRYNQKLSERRAGAVRDELVLRGIAPAAITTVGRGETELLVPTRDGVREPSNRRAQIVIVKK